MKVVRDANDFDNYGGTVIPRSMSVAAANSRGPISEKEHRAGQFDFSATQHRWVNRDLSQTPGYQNLSEGFRNVFRNAKVCLLLLTDEIVDAECSSSCNGI